LHLDFGKICKKANKHIDFLLAYGIIGLLEKLLDHNIMTVRKDACLIVARIADGN
jgi:hypothetical protein